MSVRHTLLGDKAERDLIGDEELDLKGSGTATTAASDEPRDILIIADMLN